MLCFNATAADKKADAEKIDDAISWLKNEAHRIIRASKREMKDGTAAFPPQVGLGYEAFWLRDYEYSLEGSISSYSDEELLSAARLFVSKLDPNGAGVDCIKFDGTPIYKPGFGSMGENPVADGSQFTVGVVWHTYRRTKNDAFLRDVLAPIVTTMNSVPRNRETGLVHIDPARKWDRCPYGFTDSIRKQGDELFCSLLYVNASRQLADLLSAGGRNEEAKKWQQEVMRLEKSVRDTFWDQKNGLLRAATVKCREHDIWGSAFAVYLGVTTPEQSNAIARYFEKNYSQIVQHGQVRQLPGGVYWEQAGCKRDQYQNGAFWATPVGWFVYTLDIVNPSLADQTVIDMVTHFKQHGACEWIIGEKRQLPNYIASAALPLDGIKAMLDRRAKKRVNPNNTSDGICQPADGSPKG